MPRRSLVPYLSPADWLNISVCANQLVRYSGPSTVRLKSFWALIWSSQLIGGIKSAAPILAFLNISLMSGFWCSPAPVVITPSLKAYQRAISSSRVMICATRLCSFTRALNFGCHLAACLRSCAAPNRMMGNVSLANAIVSSSLRAAARRSFRAGHVPLRGASGSDGDFAIIPSRLKPAPSPADSWLPHLERVGCPRGRDPPPPPGGEGEGVGGLGPIGESRTPSPPPSPVRGE